MSKEEIVNELQSWLTGEDFVPNKERIENLTKEFNALRDATERAQQEAFTAEHGEETEVEFNYHPDAEDARFKELLDIYHERRKIADKERAEAAKQNLKEKKELLAQINEVIQDEENIAKAYKRFKRHQAKVE